MNRFEVIEEYLTQELEQTTEKRKHYEKALQILKAEVDDISTLENELINMRNDNRLKQQGIPINDKPIGQMSIVAQYLKMN